MGASRSARLSRISFVLGRGPLSELCRLSMTQPQDAALDGFSAGGPAVGTATGRAEWCRIGASPERAADIG